MTKFPCSGCGACCRKINVAVANSKMLSNMLEVELPFPYGWDEKGVCEMLEDNRCKVYETRPLLCRVDDLGKLFKKKSILNKRKFHKLTARACNILIDEFKINKSFKVKL